MASMSWRTEWTPHSARSVPASRKAPWLAACCAVLAWNLPGAVLEGVVLENSSGRPLARSKVSLEAVRGLAITPVNAVISDSRGRFSFPSLPDGAYLLSARRSGYAAGKFGQKRWNGAGTPIVLEGDRQFFAEVRLRRLGSISGEVLDENHVGLPGHPVYAFRAGQQPLRMAAGGGSDDRGIYRISGLEPGLYFIRTGARELEDGRGLLPTFFGQTTAAQRAKPVEVDFDAEAAGISIEPLPGRLATVNGRIAGAPSATVVLYSDTGKREATTGPDGAFSFDQLAPGEYQLLAEATNPSRAAYRKLSLGEGTAQIGLELGPLPTLRIRCEEKTGKPFERRQVSVFLRRNEPPGPGVQRALGGETVVLSPGEYSVGALPRPDMYVESIWAAPQRRQAPNVFTALPGESLELTVILSSQPAGVSGKVLGPDGQPVAGAPVFLHAVDPEICARLSGSRNTRSDDRGEFQFLGLPPGRFQLFSSFDFQEIQEQEWGGLRTRTIVLEERQQASADVQLQGDL